MKKALTKYFLPLLIFLFSGYSIIYANPNQKHTAGSAIDIIENNVIANFVPLMSCEPLHAFPAVTTSPKEIHKVFAEVNEEGKDEFIFAQKYAGINNYFTAFFARKTRNFCDTIKTRLPFLTHKSYFSYSLYIRLCVIRI